METLIVAHVPVLHRGYIEFFERWASRGAVGVEVLSEEIVSGLTVVREIRALTSGLAVRMIHSLEFFKFVELLKDPKEPESKWEGYDFVLPNEEVSRRFGEKYLPGCKVQLDDVFLRWDETSVHAVKPTRYSRISTDPFDQEMIKRTRREGQKSSDWWRRVGALLVKDNAMILESHNQHVPSEHTPYAMGDPRDFMKAGDRPEISSTLHAEEAIICEAARRGVALEGAWLYATIFPCAKCAKYIAYSGIKKCFFTEGWASLDGAEVMEACGVELVLVQ